MLLDDDDIRGESAYQPMLEQVDTELYEKELLVEQRRGLGARSRRVSKPATDRHCR